MCACRCDCPGDCPFRGNEARTGDHYVRPAYLKDFVATVEEYWSQMDKLKSAHRRAQFAPKIRFFRK